MLTDLMSGQHNKTKTKPKITKVREERMNLGVYEVFTYDSLCVHLNFTQRKRN